MAAVGVGDPGSSVGGLQLALVLAASWMVWCLLGRWTEVEHSGRHSWGLLGLAVAVIPGLAVNLAPGPGLCSGDMPADVFWLLSVELQSPQHMLPHLWRMPQWLAWGCYLALAALAIAANAVRRSRVPIRLQPSMTDLPDNLAAGSAPAGGFARGDPGWPGVAWYAIEVRHEVRVTVFQPFRMATVARGIALVVAGGTARDALWRTGDGSAGCGRS